MKWTTFPAWIGGESVGIVLTTSEPGPPQSVLARDVHPKGTEVLLQWLAPVSEGGSTITKYQYRRGELKYGAYSEWRDVGGDGTTVNWDVKMPYM